MNQNLVKMSRTPELSDPRTYVSNQGIVELHYGVENSTVEWQQDLYDYVRESLAEGLYFNYMYNAFITKVVLGSKVNLDVYSIFR